MDDDGRALHEAQQAQAWTGLPGLRFINPGLSRRRFIQLAVATMGVLAGTYGCGTTQPVPPAPCACDDDCVDNPNWTCSFTGDYITVQDIRIANAVKGNLILSPGGAGGTIGGLLHALTPPQHYSHMGIMVRDLTLIRHCTAEAERMTAKEYFTGSVFLGAAPAPTNGLTKEHVRWGWPGSVTQSIEQAYRADRDLSYQGALLLDPESPSKATYNISALSFDAASDDGKTFYPALVVKPCPAPNPAVTDALNRVAEAAMQAYAHYRFYSYTDGSIRGSVDASWLASPWWMLDALPGRDPTTMKWLDWSDPTKLKGSVRPTNPACCSTFVWQAVQAASAAGRKILLDVDQGQEPPSDRPGCSPRAVEPDWSGDLVDQSTLDGLYLYTEDERRTAAKTLHDGIYAQVYESIKDAMKALPAPLSAIGDLLDDIGPDAFVTIVGGGAAAFTAAFPELLPLSAAASAALIDQLTEALYALPSTVANQLTNAFAFDCEDVSQPDPHCVDGQGNPISFDSGNWQQAPGVGRTVSPDNIHMFWDPPVSSGSPDPATPIDGLYGYNEPVKLANGVFKQPRCAIVPSSGTATLFGTVTYKGQVITGATVKASCFGPVYSGQLLFHQTDPHSYTTGTTPGYGLTVKKGGQYLVTARYFDPQTQTSLYGQVTTAKIQYSNERYDIVMLDPPGNCMRNILVSGTIEAYDAQLFGEKSQSTYLPPATFYVQFGVPVFVEDQTTPANTHWECDLNDQMAKAQTEQSQRYSAEVSGGGTHVDLDIDVVLGQDLTATVTFTSTLNPQKSNKKQLTTSVTVARDQMVSVDGDLLKLDNGDAVPDRAFFYNLQVSNAPAGAY